MWSLEEPVGLVVVGLLALVGDSGCLALTGVGMQAVGMAHSDGTGAATNTRTVAINEKEITRVGRTTLNWGNLPSCDRLLHMFC